MDVFRAWIFFSSLFGCIAAAPSVQNLDHQPPIIRRLHINSDIVTRFATTLVTSTISNPDKDSREAVFEVTLPDEAFISKFLMEIDGQVYEGNIEEKEAAAQRYLSAKAKGQSAGHITKRPRETNRFMVEVNVASQAEVTFNLTYQELLKRKFGQYEHVIYIDPGQTVADMMVAVSIDESRPITSLRVPQVTNQEQVDDLYLDDQETDITIERPQPNTANIVYRPRLIEQKRHSREGISGRFIVKYEIEREQDTGDLTVADGYFVHFFAPPDMEPIPKDVLFILDKSGSMDGQKMSQLIEAMGRIIEDLHEGDRFSYAVFSNEVNFWKHTLQSVSAANIRKAQKDLSSIEADGATNIHAAVTQGLRFLNQDRSEDRSKVIVFLTDGQPTNGLQNKDMILDDVREINRKGIPIFCLAFGRDADFELTKKISLQNHGLARRIFEDSDASMQISGFYDEISITILKNVSFQYINDQSGQVMNTTKSTFNTYFDGTEIVVAGKLPEDSVDDLSVRVTGHGTTGDLDLTSHSDAHPVSPNRVTSSPVASNLESGSQSMKTTEKMWAYLSIKQLTDEMNAAVDESVKESIKQKILALSLKYKFVTPLTSMVVTKPDEQILADQAQADDAQAYDDASSQTNPAPPAPSRSGGRHHGGYGGGGDPHFMVRLPGLTHPICFDIQAEPKTILSILRDTKLDLIINAAIVPALAIRNTSNTYMGEIFIKIKKNILVITPMQIIVNSVFTAWTDETSETLGNIVLQTSQGGKVLRIHIHNDVTIAIRRHLKTDIAVDYLNIFVENDAGLSRNSSGLLGQFVTKHVWLRRFEEKHGRTYGYFKSKQGSLTSHFRTRLHSKHDFIEDTEYTCWNANKGINGLIVGEISSYTLPSFFV